MKIYNNNVEFSYQSIGSAWLGILRGPRREVEYTFNGLYNLRATEGDIKEYEGYYTFWTSKEQIRKFFILKNLASRDKDIILNDVKANQYADEKLAELQDCSEVVLRFNELQNNDFYDCGSIIAEKPDIDIPGYVSYDSLDKD